MSVNELNKITTPALLLDEVRMIRNIRFLADRANKLGVQLRPHIKTAKSIEVAHRVFEGGSGPVTVSTLAEGEALFAAGFSDTLYAVGIAPSKLERVLALREKGCDIAVILDSEEQADALSKLESPIRALIEIDSDGHRGGLRYDDPMLVTIGRKLGATGSLAGVMTHAGESYFANGSEAQAEFAEIERRAAVAASDALRQDGLACPIVSVGSTPTAYSARDLSGVTELRAGVYMFFDLVMAGIGVCSADDIALSVLTTVIGHQPEKGWTMIDAGWMALSRDRGTAKQAVDQGYGVVCDSAGQVIPGLIVSAANQEHGIVTRRSGSEKPLPELPIGTLLRILPNHACATAAQHAKYQVIGTDGHLGPVWERFGGW
jgi:D-serine deaminase-like pyridoxal phosphate-dependent protein